MSEDGLHTIVGTAIGEASMCWRPLPTGVFESERAKDICDRLMRDIRSRQPAPTELIYAVLLADNAMLKATVFQLARELDNIDEVAFNNGYDSVSKLSRGAIVAANKALRSLGLTK